MRFDMGLERILPSSSVPDWILERGARGGRMATDLTYACTSDYPKHREQMIALHKRGYGEVYEALYDSLYLENPYGEPLLGLCYDGDKLVGQENYIRQDVGANGRIHKGALGINTFVDPKYRLFHGVFGKLCKLTVETLERQVDVLCAYANEESEKYYLKYFGWKIASEICVYKKATGFSGVKAESLLAYLRRGKAEEELSLREVKAFDPEVLDPVVDAYLKRSPHHYFHKPCTFLNWKFMNNKHYGVRGFYIQREDRVCGYCVTWDQGVERKIVDILIQNDQKDVLQKTLSTLAYMARKQGKKRLVVFGTQGCWYEDCLKKQLFVPRWRFNFITRACSGEDLSASWIIHPGDFDIF
jgi:hypothetical protein